MRQLYDLFGNMLDALVETPPITAEILDGHDHTGRQYVIALGGYVVRDANGQALAFIYSRETEREAMQAKVLTKDEARRIAINIARLPDLLGKGERD
jgi:hypothetical protein